MFANLRTFSPAKVFGHAMFIISFCAEESTVESMECVVCLNKNYTNKRTKFKITAALQRDTQQVV